MIQLFRRSFILIASSLYFNFAFGLEIGSAAPLFSLENQKGEIFSLKENKSKTWTVLYFYPKAGTPGCTTQACAFRDSIKIIQKEGAVVFGISTDSVLSLNKFHKEHMLNFDLLSDKDGKISELYGTKMPILTMSKRITFIIDDKLTVRSIDNDVDPALNAKKVAEEISVLKKQK
jgi:peroxiredoxin Q/BCP